MGLSCPFRFNPNLAWHFFAHESRSVVTPVLCLWYCDIDKYDSMLSHLHDSARIFVVIVYVIEFLLMCVCVPPCVRSVLAPAHFRRRWTIFQFRTEGPQKLATMIQLDSTHVSRMQTTLEKHDSPAQPSTPLWAQDGSSEKMTWCRERDQTVRYLCAKTWMHWLHSVRWDIANLLALDLREDTSKIGACNERAWKVVEFGTEPPNMPSMEESQWWCQQTVSSHSKGVLVDAPLSAPLILTNSHWGSIPSWIAWRVFVLLCLGAW